MIQALLLRKLAREMAFDIVTTEGIICSRQYDRIDDLIACELRGDKGPIQRQFLVDELYVSAVHECFDPLFVSHFVPLQPRSMISGCVPAFLRRSLHPKSVTRAMCGLFCVPAEEECSDSRMARNIAPLRADCDMRGFAISFLTLARTASSEAFLVV